MELVTASSRDTKRSRRKAEYILDDPLLTAAEAAAERGQAISAFWRDVRAGHVPAAYYPSPRCPRCAARTSALDPEETRAIPKQAT